MVRRAILLVATIPVLATLGQGCAPKTRYAWGGYDATLYSYYKNPQDQEAYLKRLQEIVQEAETQNRIPPGLYAEYGYALYEAGNIPEALSYFEKEKAKWPESNVLMEKMIRNAKQREKQRSLSNAGSPSPAESSR